MSTLPAIPDLNVRPIPLVLLVISVLTGRLSHRDIGLDEDRFAAQGFNFGEDLMAFLLAVPADHDLRAPFGQTRLQRRGTVVAPIDQKTRMFNLALPHI